MNRKRLRVDVLALERECIRRGIGDDWLARICDALMFLSLVHAGAKWSYKELVDVAVRADQLYKPGIGRELYEQLSSRKNPFRGSPTTVIH